jgi:hypothetical protein
VREALVKTGGTPMQATGEEARAIVRRDVQHWSALVGQLGIRAE